MVTISSGVSSHQGRVITRKAGLGVPGRGGRGMWSRDEESLCLVMNGGRKEDTANKGHFFYSSLGITTSVCSSVKWDLN